MKLFDVNLLVYAARQEMNQHAQAREWFESLVNSGEAFGFSELVASGFVRVVTNARTFKIPTTLEQACGVVESLYSAPNCIRILSGQQHWSIFSRLLKETAIIGPRVSDVYHAALAIEHDCVWCSADSGFKRFVGLKWENPLDTIE
ncbi:MAG TPA: type II toxin-antitoxin system VapC family toxin [Tepidisphaeraceae bacterium]